MFADAHVAMEAIWRERLENARVRHEAAKAALQVARERQSQLTSPDDTFAVDHALRAEHHSLAEFKGLLTIFNGLVVHGKIPEED